MVLLCPQNELLIANTCVTVLAAAIAFSGYITGLFGMNLDNTAYIQVRNFDLMKLFMCLLFIIIIFIIIIIIIIIIISTLTIITITILLLLQ